MQGYPSHQYYNYAQYPPQRQQPAPGTYLTGFSASFPHHVNPPAPPAAPMPGPAYPPFPTAPYPPREHYEAWPVVPQQSKSSRHRDGMHRSHSMATPNPNAMPLKSAMKKRGHERSGSMGNPQMGHSSMVPMGPSMSRTPSRAPSEQRERANSTTRRRADSIPYKHEHVFLTFPSSNEVRLDNADLNLVEEMRQNVLPSWPPGVAEEGLSRSEPVWRAQFNGTPWASSGRDAIFARQMICSVYATLARQGYSYCATASTSNPPAKLIFTRSVPEAIPYFFTISFSQSGGKLSILDAPQSVPEGLNHSLRSIFQGQVMADRATEDGLYAIELRKNTTGWESDRTRFTTFILGHLTSLGFKLDGTIPMGKAGPLGFGSRKELWIFRASQRRPGSAHGRNRDGSINGPRDGSQHGHGSAHDHEEDY